MNLHPETHNVLVRAFNLLEREGWWSFWHFRSAAGGCMMTAVDEASHGNDLVYNSCLHALNAAIGGRRRRQAFLLWIWNDWPSRSYEDVRQVYQIAIAATAPAQNDTLDGFPILRKEALIYDNHNFTFSR